MAYGAWRILGTARLTQPSTLAIWLVGAVLIHDLVIAPLTMATGWLIGRLVPSRARRYLVGGLVAGALVTAVAVPLIYRRGTVVASKQLETQNYTSNLMIILGAIAAVTTVAYVVRLVRDRTATGRDGRRSSAANDLPPADQQSRTP